MLWLLGLGVQDLGLQGLGLMFEFGSPWVYKEDLGILSFILHIWEEEFGSTTMYAREEQQLLQQSWPTVVVMLRSF